MPLTSFRVIAMPVYCSHEPAHKRSSLEWDDTDHEAWDLIEIAQGPGSAKDKHKKISDRLRELFPERS